MTRFALPYDPDAAPVQWIFGRGFSPAWQPADFVGPRLDCPMWVPAPDADAAWLSKYDGAIDPYAILSGYAWGTWLPGAAQHGVPITAAELAGRNPALQSWQAATPWLPAPPRPWQPCCIITEPDRPLPQPAPVPVETATAALLGAALLCLAAVRARKKGSRPFLHR